MPDFRRGTEHIRKANESAASEGEFRPFLSNIYWKDDGEERFVLILNPIEDIPMVQMQKAWTTDDRAELVIARTDEAIGEKKDPLLEQWGYGPQDLNVCVAVELEPEFEVVKGRKRPTNFVVKTRTFTRRVRDAAGELTEEREEVTAPVIGLIAQSPNNFFNHVASKDANNGPVHECALLIRRLGTDKSTDYEIELFLDQEVDLSGLLDFIDGLSYLNDEMDDLLDGIESVDDKEAAQLIGSILLDKRLNELAQEEIYNEVLAKVEQPARYPAKGWKKSGSSDKGERKAAPRASRPSQRRARREERVEAEVAAAEAGAAEAADTEAAETEASDAKEQEEPKPKRTRARARSGSSGTTKADPVSARITELRAKAAAAKAAKAAA